MNGWRTDCSLSWPRPETLGARSGVGQSEYALVVGRHDVGAERILLFTMRVEWLGPGAGQV